MGKKKSDQVLDTQTPLLHAPLKGPDYCYCYSANVMVEKFKRYNLIHHPRAVNNPIRFDLRTR